MKLDLPSFLQAKPKADAPEKKQTDDKKVLAGKVNALLPKSFGLDLRMNEMSRYFSSNTLIEKALTTLDKSALLIIGVSWFVALAAVGLAFVGVREASSFKIKLDTAKALEPVLPKINRMLLTKDQYQPLLERLKKQFPDVQFEVTSKPTLRIYSNKGDEFIDWLNAVSYTDSMVPSIRWSLVSFCVGSECPGEFVMHAELTAEAINITQPETKL